MQDKHPTRPLAGQDSALKKWLRAEFEQGLAMAADPSNADLPDLAVRITTLFSPWFSAICKVCKHKYREGDRVRLCPQCGTPYHDDAVYGLRCWQAHFQGGRLCSEGGVDRLSDKPIPRCEYRGQGQLPDEPEPGDGESQPHPSPAGVLTGAFVRGLETVWRPFGEQRPVQVVQGDAIVGRRCPWCRFDIRASDRVVACPCGCGAYFHQDIFRHLDCWNEWSGLRGKGYCPVTGRPLNEAADDGS